jgi:hypothetical protein
MFAGTALTKNLAQKSRKRKSEAPCHTTAATTCRAELSDTRGKNLYQAIRSSLVNTVGTYLCPSEVECAAMSFFGAPPAPLGGSGNGSQDTGDAGRGEGGSAHKKSKRDETPTGLCVNLFFTSSELLTYMLTNHICQKLANKSYLLSSCIQEAAKRAKRCTASTWKKNGPEASLYWGPLEAARQHSSSM